MTMMTNIRRPSFRPPRSSRWVPGNHFELLENGEEFFPRVYEAIEQAQHEVMLETFILFEDNPPLPAWDQDRWMTGWNREAETWAQTLERFRVLRESTLRLLRATPESDRDRTGIHAERGPQKAWEQRILHAGHDINHLRQIEAIANKMRAAQATA